MWKIKTVSYSFPSSHGSRSLAMLYASANAQRSHAAPPVAQPCRAFPVQSGTKVLIFDVIAKSFFPHCPVPSETPALKLSSRNETRILALSAPYMLSIFHIFSNVNQN